MDLGLGQNIEKIQIKAELIWAPLFSGQCCFISQRWLL